MREVGLVKNSILYFCGSILSKLIGFLLLPLYTSYLEPSDYGYYNLANTYLTLLTSVVCLEIWSTIMRFMFDFETHSEKYKPIFNGVIIFIVAVLIIIGVFFCVNQLICIDYAGLILVYGLSICFSNLYGYIARGFGYNKTFAVSGVLSICINVAVNFLLLLRFKWDYSALYVANIVSLICQCLFIERKIKIWNNIKISLFDIALIKNMFVFTFPYCLNTATFWFLNSYSRTVIASVMGTEFNGFFSVASNFALAISLVSSCVVLAWQEEAFRIGSLADDKVIEYYSVMTDKYLKYLCILAGMILPLIYLIFPYLINAKYNEALTIIPFFVLATAESAYCSFLTAIFGAIKKTNVLFISTFIAGGINLLSVHLLIGNFGMQAATISMVLGFLVNIMLRIFILKKYICYRIDVKKIFTVYLPLFFISCFVFEYTNARVNFWLLNGYFIVTYFAFDELRKNVFCYKNERKM